MSSFQPTFRHTPAAGRGDKARLVRAFLHLVTGHINERLNRTGLPAVPVRGIVVSASKIIS